MQFLHEDKESLWLDFADAQADLNLHWVPETHVVVLSFVGDIFMFYVCCWFNLAFILGIYR